MLVFSVVRGTGILLLLHQKQLNASANCLAFCYAVLLAVFRKILFCFSIQTDTVSNIFRLFYFWPPRAWGHSISPLFLSHLYYNLCHTKSQALFQKNLTKVGGCVSHPPTSQITRYGWLKQPPIGEGAFHPPLLIRYTLFYSIPPDPVVFPDRWVCISDTHRR